MLEETIDHSDPIASRHVRVANTTNKVSAMNNGTFVCRFKSITDPTDQIMRLARYYQRELGLEIPVLKSVAIPANAMDSNRGQLVAEKLAEDLRNEFPQLACDPQAILIGFTAQDVYIAAKQWKFAFGWRDDARTAVVSTARMDLHYFGQPFWGSSPEVRLRKMVTKDIGILYYGLPQSNDPKSVLYNNIMGIQELDAVGEDF